MKYVCSLFVALFICFQLSAQQTWKLDSGHSNVRFEVAWQDFSIRTGEFKSFSGSIELDSINDFTDARFSFEVDPNSIDVIADKLAGVLIGEKFLDTEKYPEILFSSNDARKVDENRYLTSGTLFIHGVEKEQEVSIVFKGRKMARKGETFGIEVSFEFNRNDFGLVYGSPRLGEKVKVVGHLLYLEAKP